MGAQFLPEGARLIRVESGLSWELSGRSDLAPDASLQLGSHARRDRVGQFHYIIKVTCHVFATDLQNVHQPFMGTGNRFEFLQPAELPFEMLSALVGLAENDLNGA